jgi:uncharacterized SAM-binding protein YcdF (DUF218 family)
VAAFWPGAIGAIALAVAGGLAFAKDGAGMMLQRLMHVRHLPESASAGNDVVYVLGGTPDSLRAKFQIAAKLLRDGKAARVLVLSQQTSMGFSPVLGRNQTADKWVVRNLGAYGITPKAIELVAVKEEFFGTWSEAKSLSRIVRERGHRRLLLVTSPFHSRRVWESFSRTVEHPDESLFLYLSDEPTHLRHLLPEYLKLLLYRVMLY